MQTNSSFLTTLGAMMAVAVPIAGVSWFIADSVFVKKEESAEVEKKQIEINTKIQTSTEQLSKRLDETNSHLKNLNTVLEKINITERRR